VLIQFSSITVSVAKLINYIIFSLQKTKNIIIQLNSVSSDRVKLIIFLNVSILLSPMSKRYEKTK